jgi:hypothetical protein
MNIGALAFSGAIWRRELIHKVTYIALLDRREILAIREEIDDVYTVNLVAATRK